jgi:agmatine/peptidylarginine deiminase
MIDEVVECYRCMVREIALREPLLIVAQNPDEASSQLADIIATSPHPIQIIPCPTNDTWARDHAFITLLDGKRRRLLDYQFNGWGMKFAANLDNQINRTIYPQLRQQLGDADYQSCLDFVFEGGSIESDGQGTLLTTASCLLAANRNDTLTPQQIEQRLLSDLHAQRLLWLHHGHLLGDDTDGHIDTLARFCPDDTIAYVQCTDAHDPHYDALRQMETELQSFRTLDGRPYRLVALPMPDAIFDDEGLRLPATYANFLVVNGAVLYPTYCQAANDRQARQQLQLAFPHHDIVGIDCSVLIRQHGSLHCCTMQYPA